MPFEYTGDAADKIKVWVLQRPTAASGSSPSAGIDGGAAGNVIEGPFILPGSPEQLGELACAALGAPAWHIIFRRHIFFKIKAADVAFIFIKGHGFILIDY